QVVKLIGEVEKVFLQRVEALDELVALLERQQRVDLHEAVVDLLLAGVVSSVGQRLVAKERRLPALELGLQVGAEAVLPIRPHLGEQVFAQAAGVLDRLGSEVSRFRRTILRRFAEAVIASYTLSMGNRVESIIRLISLRTISRAISSSTSSS